MPPLPSSLCSSQVSESTKIPTQLSGIPQSQKRQLFPCQNLGICRSSCNKTLRLHIQEKDQIAFNYQKRIKSRSTKSVIFASLPVISSSSTQVASSLFTFGTAFVIPFYTVMIVAPHAKWTKKLVESSLPYVVLGMAYVYLLYLSWSPETLQLMFASKYWLPELPGITKMFSGVLTVASAWLHLLAVDLFAGRQIYLDGCKHALETRHSLVLCLLFCPIGILSHYITKAVVQLWRRIMATQEAPDVAKMYS